MTDSIEFIYQPDCPNVDAARAALRQALVATGKEPRWREWNSTLPTCPPHARAYGSPTILINGLDVAGAEPSHAPACRIYRDATGRSVGAPPVELIGAALRAGKPVRALGGFAALPTIGVALLPKLTCAACWPAYSAALAAFGVSFVDYTPYLSGLLAAAVALTGIVLVRQARRQRSYLPLLVGAAGAGILMVAKVGFDHAPMTYGGAAVLTFATFWSSWATKRARCGVCAGPNTG